MVDLYKIIIYTDGDIHKSKFETYPEVKLNDYYAEWIVAAPYLLNLIDDIKKSITNTKLDALLYVIDHVNFRKTKSIKLENGNYSFELIKLK